jgi:hypothetical protein
MELKIKAWGFTHAVLLKTDAALASLANWQPHAYAMESNFIAALRDDVRRIKSVVAGATLMVGLIGATPRQAA